MTTLDEVRPDIVSGGQPSGIARALRRILIVTALLDLILVAASTWAASFFSNRFDYGPVNPAVAPVSIVAAGVCVTAAWMLSLLAEGGYNIRNFGSGPQEFRQVARASVIAGGGVGLACYLSRVPLSREFVVLTFVIGTPLLLLERYLVRQRVHSARKAGRLLHRVVAVGDAVSINEVLSALRRDQYIGYKIVGACMPNAREGEDNELTVPVIHDVGDAEKFCAALDADTVLVARGGIASSRQVRQIAWDLEGSDISLVVVPSLTDIAGPRIHLRPIAGLPLLHLEPPQAGKAGGLTKRAFDVVFALLALCVLAPVFLTVGIIVKLSDGGPVFFRQSRVGRNGQPFEMVKFRSMVLDAEARLEALLAHNESDGLLFKMEHDPRITRVGRFLRRYSVDELPQLLNVIRGDMSLVGPRPPLPSEVNQYAVDVRRRLLVRPGLTGLWQVSGRSSISWEESVRLDLFYVDNWSMTSDLLIIAKTVRAVVGSSGAY